MFWRIIFFFFGVSILIPVVVFSIVVVGMQLPIENYYLSNGFGAKYTDKYVGHLGEDYAVNAGTQVKAIADGEVVKSFSWALCDKVEIVDGLRKKIEDSHGWGGVVIIKHEASKPDVFVSEGTILTSSTENKPNVVYSLYGHLTNIKVGIGDIVKKGDIIADIAKMCLYDPHLHFEIKDLEAYTNDILGGVGKGYSGTTGFAPHRYSPSKFIELNKNLGVQDKTDAPNIEYNLNFQPQYPYSPPSFWNNVKTFFSSIFSSLNDKNEGQNVEGEKVEKQQEEKTELTKTENVLPLYSADILDTPHSISSKPGEDIVVKVQVKNTGKNVWRKSEYISLNVIGGAEKNSIYKHSSWVTSLRPALMEQHEVENGQTASFSFLLHSPDTIQTYRLQLMVVRYTGSTYEQIGNEIYSLDIVVGDEKEEIKQSITKEDQLSKQDDTEKNVFEKIVRGIKEIQEKGFDVLKHVTKAFPFFGGGSSTSDIVEVTETEAPYIALVYPTSSPFVIDDTSAVVIGSYNSATTYILVNDEITDALLYDAEHLLWYYSVDSTSTGTISFVGWDSAYEHHSEPINLEIIYNVPEVPDISITHPTSTPWYTSLSDIILEGTYNSSTYSIIINDSSDGVIMDPLTYTWSYRTQLSVGTTTFSILGVNQEQTKQTTTTTIEMVYEKPLDTLQTPTILYPTTSTYYETSHSSLTLGGEKTEDTSYVFVSNKKTQTTSTSTIVSSTTWEYSLYLEEGINYIEIYGMNAEGIVSPTTSIEIVYDNIGPVLLDVVSAPSNHQYGFTASYKGGEAEPELLSYDIEFMIGLDTDYITQCSQDDVVYVDADHEMLRDIHMFFDYITEYPCVWFTKHSTSTNIEIEFGDYFYDFMLDVRVRGYDIYENVGDWCSPPLLYLPEFPCMGYETEGRVVISEIAWAGTRASDEDEWFELFNIVEDSCVDITDWQLEWGDSVFVFPTVGLNRKYSQELFERGHNSVISNWYGMLYQGGLFNDEGEHIILRNNRGEIVDEIDFLGGWPAGDKLLKKSMERRYPVIEGSRPEAWGTHGDFWIGEVITGENRFYDAQDYRILGSPSNSPIAEL